MGVIGETHFTLVSVCAVATSLMFNILTQFPVGTFFTTQRLHRKNGLEFDPKGHGQQTNQNRAISIFFRVQDKSGATRGSRMTLHFTSKVNIKVSSKTWSQLRAYQHILVLFEVLL